MRCLILAGGFGTRMRPLTADRPKALIPVGDRPFADVQLEMLSGQGVTEVVYAVGHLGQQIEQFVGTGARWGISVRYSYERGALLGTGGAVRLALDHGLLGQRFFVLYGDSYLTVSFREVLTAFDSSGLPALMTVLANENRWGTSNAVYLDGRVVLYDKGGGNVDPAMRWIDYGLSVLTPEAVLDLVPPKRTYDLSEAFHRLSVEGRLAGYLAGQRFYEVGSPAGLADLEQFLGNGPDAAARPSATCNTRV